MIQCVPSWDVEDSHAPPRLTFLSNSNSLAPDVPTSDYEVAELTWKNGQLAMHGLSQPRVQNKTTTPNTCPTTTKYQWDKPRAGGTLESIVNQATSVPFRKFAMDGGGEELAPWFDHQRPLVVEGAAPASMTMTMDALVPCSNAAAGTGREPAKHVGEGVTAIGTRVVESSTRVGSCSGAAAFGVGSAGPGPLHGWSSMAERSGSGSATFGKDSRQMTLDTCEKGLGADGYTSTSMGSPENTSSSNPKQRRSEETTADDHDSVSHGRSQRKTRDEENKKGATGKSSVSTKRSRAAAIHNQSERKRRDKINQKMKTLQKLVPNSSKTDKASMLDEVIEYLKQLQAQVSMMSRINFSPMIMPMAMQQMSMMAPLGMGMGIGVGVVDMNSVCRSNLTGIPSVLHPTAAFMALPSWDGTGDRTASILPDPLSYFLSCQSQPMTMEAYIRLAAMYQQFQQSAAPGSKN